MKMRYSKKVLFSGILSLAFCQFAYAQVQKETSENPSVYAPPPTRGIEVENPDEIHIRVDEMASPKKGSDMNELRRAFVNKLDVKKLFGVGKVQTVITFVVEKDGSITNMKSSGSNKNFNIESKNTLEKLLKKAKWNPAKVNNKVVRSEYKFPVTMIFE